MAFHRAMPVLPVSDVTGSVAFYERVGFVSHGVGGDPAAFSIMQRGDVTVALERWTGDGPLPIKNGWAAYIYVDDADAFAGELEAAGIPRNGPIYDSPWGMRDSAFDDPDGNTLAFGHPLNDAPNGPGLGADRGAG